MADIRKSVLYNQLVGRGKTMRKRQQLNAAELFTDRLARRGVKVDQGKVYDAFADMPLESGAGGGCAVQLGRLPQFRRPYIVDTETHQGGAAGNGIAVAVGTGFIAAFLADSNADWDLSGGQNGQRKFARGTSSRNNLHGLIKNAWVTKAEPVLEVTVWADGGAPDKDLSDLVTRKFQSEFALHIDPHGRGEDLALDPTFIEDFPFGGLELNRDQVYKIDDESYMRFDYKGTGKLSDYTLGDIFAKVQCFVSVEVGVKLSLEHHDPRLGMLDDE